MCVEWGNSYPAAQSLRQGLQGARFPCLAFPDGFDEPAGLTELLGFPLIPLPVLGYLSCPERQVRSRLNGAVGACVTVPKAPMHEDHRQEAGKDNVRGPGQGRYVHAEAEAFPVKKTADGKFRGGVSPTNRLHQLRSLRREHGRNDARKA